MEAGGEMEDMGEKSMKGGKYGIKNLQRTLPSLPEWTSEEADKYDNLNDLYKQVVGQFSRYMGHVLKNVGSVYETFHSVEQPGDVYAPAPKARQQEAVVFLNKQLFETPRWLLDYSILNKISNPAGGDPVGSIQSGVLNSLLSANRLNSLLQSAARFGDTHVYTAEDLLADAHQEIWKELTTHQPIDAYRRNLEKSYAEAIITIIGPAPAVTGLPPGIVLSFGPGTKNTDLPSIARGELVALRSRIQAAIPATTDRLSKYHLEDLAERIRQALNPKG